MRKLIALLATLCLLVILVPGQDIVHTRKPASAVADDLTDITVRLRAQSLVLSDNDPIATFTDTSGAGNDFAQGTAGRRPLFKAGIVNGKAVARFDNLDDRVERANSGIITTTAWTIVVVLNAATADSNAAASYDNDGVITDSGGNFNVSIKTGATAHVGNFDGTDDQASVAISTGTWVILVARRDATTLYIRKNNGSDATVASGSTTVGGDLLVGINFDALARFGGDIAELRIYNVTKNDTAVGNIVAALNAEYAVF